MLEPVIKCCGSKRTQADEILKYLPKNTEVYYEPFLGGASVLRRLLTMNTNIKKYVASDVNSDLIGLYQILKNDPKLVIDYYTKLWKQYNSNGNNYNYRKEFFESVRDKFNKEHNPLDFMFIMRTTTNGMPRYNSNGAFNSSCHFSRPGINPETFKTIIYDWNNLSNLYDVEFRCCDYNSIEPSKNDFCYLDPPYAHTKGIYFGAIDLDTLWNYLRNLKCKWVLSFDGKKGNIDNTYDVPTDLYSEHKYLLSGTNSNFRSISKNNTKLEKSVVYESIYISKD